MMVRYPNVRQTMLVMLLLCGVGLSAGLPGCKRSDTDANSVESSSEVAGDRASLQPQQTRNEEAELVVESSSTNASGIAAQTNLEPTTESEDVPSEVRRLVATEELILQLTPRLKRLSDRVYNLQLPSPAEPSVRFEDTDRKWRSLLDATDHFEHAKFAIVSGRFLDSGWQEFQTDVRFSGKARDRSDHVVAVDGRMQIHWNRKQDAWKIDRIVSDSLNSQRSTTTMFTEVMVQLVTDEATRNRLTESQHWTYATRHYYPKRRARISPAMKDRRFFPISTANHPGLAVVDIDQDGWDDLYVTVRWGKNQLLRNRGDGSFEEVAAEYGLDVDGRCNAAAFADLDNDGDPDLVLARSLERSAIYINESGRFIDRSKELAAINLPMEATSVTVADVNGDGLLDIYFCTYHQEDISRRLDADLANPKHRIHESLSQEHSVELARRFREQTQSFVYQIGPPNILLLNSGQARFEWSTLSETLTGWHNAFQASWADYDRDGDVDVYIANDFAPDQLFRNNGEMGFEDVSQTVGISRLGFAMGVSWGDYDRDGDFDLYVSNMYSKAGRRITAQAQRVDNRLADLAQGNYLYEWDGNDFQQRAGLTPDSLKVARAGWSWGGQFLDANNDGWLDLYVPNGYLTVPKGFESDVDL